MPAPTSQTSLSNPPGNCPPQDMERKHAGDRELWRRDTEQAVRAAREEMAALTDQRLEATTRQTIYDNEAMAGKQHGAAHFVQWSAIHCRTAQQGTAQHSTAWHGTVSQCSAAAPWCGHCFVRAALVAASAGSSLPTLSSQLNSNRPL